MCKSQKKMSTSTDCLRFTTSFFGQSPEARSKAFVHPGIIVDLFPKDFQPRKSNLCQCTKCNAFIHSQCDINYSNHIWTCTFCNTVNSLPIDSMDIQENIEIEKTQIEPPKSMYIIDGSGPSINSGLFEETLKRLEILLKDAKNVCICVLTTVLNVLGRDGKIHTFPDLTDATIPPNCFISAPLPSFKSLYEVPKDKRGPHVLTCLEVAANSVGHGGRVFMSISFKSTEKGFLTDTPMQPTQQKSPNLLTYDENTSVRGVDFDSFKYLVDMYKNNSILCSILFCQTSSQMVDVASYSRFCAETGGKLEYITPIALLHMDDIMSRFIGPRYLCSIRLSNNGCDILPSLGLSQLNPRGFSCTGKSCYTFPFSFTDKLLTFETIDCQLVTEKYGLDGSHSTIVTTKTIRATNDLNEVFKYCDCNCLVKYISSSLISLFIRGHDLDEMKGLALALLKPMFETYRIYVSRSPNRYSSLVMPKSLQYVPLYTLGVLKSTIFTQCIAYDERAGQLSRMNTMTPEEVTLFAYPTLSDVTAFVWHGGEIVPLKLTDSELREKKLLLLDNGISSWLWIGENLDKSLCQVAFAKPSQVLVDKVIRNETEQSQRLFTLVKGNFRHILQGTSSEFVFRTRMVEDAQKNYPSSVGFITELHKITLPQK